MVAHSWADGWTLFLELMNRETIAVRILTGLAIAFLAVMVLEGLRASFFPRRLPVPKPAATIKITAANDVAPSGSRDMWQAWHEPAPMAYAPKPSFPVNSTFPRRSSPQPLRVLGQRKPS